MTQRTVIATEDAPKAIGPYSQAIALGDLIFCSGQVALDPASGELQGDVRAQTRRALENLSGVLRAAGSSLADVVKTTVFLVDMGDYAAVNEVYGEFFSFEPPARSAVAVAALPRGARVEVEAIAARSGRSPAVPVQSPAVRQHYQKWRLASYFKRILCEGDTLRMAAVSRSGRERRSLMEKRSGIRLSTMEIILLSTLLGSLALGLIQAWQYERFQRQLAAEAEQ